MVMTDMLPLPSSDMAGREYQILEPEGLENQLYRVRRWDRAFLRAHELLTERNRVLQGILTHTANMIPKVLTVDAKVRMLKVRTNEGSKETCYRITASAQFEADDRNTMQHV
jgi:hypothetical protein